MTAAEVLERAHTAGLRIEVDGKDLLLEASTAPPPTVLDELRRHKPEIIVLLQAERDGWTAADWWAFYDERAGIPHFEGGPARAQVDVRAFACCVGEWLLCSPVRSAPGRCLGCGGGERPNDPLLPFGTVARDPA